jgi:hypothetical protein
MRRPSAALLALALAVGAAGLGACTDGGASGPDPDDVALEVCGTLVTWVDEISEATDGLDDEVQVLIDEGAEQTSPEVEAIFVGWVDTVEAATDGLVEAVDGLRFPPTERGAQLADDLAAAAGDARAEVDSIRADVDEVLAEDESMAGRMRTILVNTEKVLSLAEPDVEGGDDADELDQAFLAEPTCEHVTEP